jgi:hypothetical protein
MNYTLTANEIKGRAIGAIFFAAFGTLWVGLALYALECLRPASIAWLGMILMVLLVMARWVLRQGKRYPSVTDDPSLAHTFNRVNIIQWIAVGITAFTFARLHLDAYILSAITAIVGFHLFPLARLFRYRPHYFTGGLLCAWAASSALFLPVERMQGLTAMGTGMLLLASSYLTLNLATAKLRRSHPLPC